MDTCSRMRCSRCTGSSGNGLSAALTHSWGTAAGPQTSSHQQAGPASSSHQWVWLGYCVVRMLSASGLDVVRRPLTTAIKTTSPHISGHRSNITLDSPLAGSWLFARSSSCISNLDKTSFKLSLYFHINSLCS